MLLIQKDTIDSKAFRCHYLQALGSRGRGGKLIHGICLPHAVSQAAFVFVSGGIPGMKSIE
jgi:hypothetical protein